MGYGVMLQAALVVSPLQQIISILTAADLIEANIMIGELHRRTQSLLYIYVG